MTSQDTHSDPGRFEVRTTSDSHFSWIRTRLSLERTLMSWARTAVALIGFGFTIVKFFEQFNQAQDVEPARYVNAPRLLGLAMILVGVVALLISIFQYHQSMKYLWQEHFRVIAGIREGHALWTPLVAVSVVLLVIGLLAFLSILFRIG
ncbi:MAG: DUF202 domain-containing protein [Azospirillaceae bacterium]